MVKATGEQKFKIPNKSEISYFTLKLGVTLIMWRNFSRRKKNLRLRVTLL